MDATVIIEFHDSGEPGFVRRCEASLDLNFFFRPPIEGDRIAFEGFELEVRDIVHKMPPSGGTPEMWVKCRIVNDFDVTCGEVADHFSNCPALDAVYIDPEARDCDEPDCAACAPPEALPALAPESAYQANAVATVRQIEAWDRGGPVISVGAALAVVVELQRVLGAPDLSHRSDGPCPPEHAASMKAGTEQRCDCGNNALMLKALAAHVAKNLVTDD